MDDEEQQALRRVLAIARRATFHYDCEDSCDGSQCGLNEAIDMLQQYDLEHAYNVAWYEVTR